jgi:hypothetical protein
MPKDRKEIEKEIMEVEFENTSSSKDYDDDGYEEGKLKEREISADDLPMSKEGGPEYRDPSGKKITLREFEKAMKNESKKKK